ncbi:HNH endonuclease signature motif containing protein [Shinella oryzae]|uniref:HNH endonuclease signature motif containing protein n=1 Tax=Shinella oryzae TaxID=2871820 RepID=A0ABY9JZF7_9HYPH|nr:HNH endonuclease signature motif containing protein [Shinella oryzae]WLS01700.1 HNH endonuclease signature motif containing protein [Shinella oryzae]
MLKLKKINTGYSVVSLSKKCIVETVTVHRLVCSAFHGEPTAGMTVNHKDGDKLNNRADNLEWATPAENTQHALRNGFRTSPDQRGAKNPRAKLTSSQAREILENPDALNGVELARKFGVTATTISYLRRRKTWENL